MYTPSKKYGMVKSTAYRKWIEKTVPLIRDGLDFPEKYPIEIEITVFCGRGFAEKSDIDNVIKSAVDSLVKAKIIPDDNIKYVTKCSARFMDFWTRKSEAYTVISYIELD